MSTDGARAPGADVGVALGGDSFGGIVDNFGVGFVLVGRNWRILRMNLAAEQILGRDAAELLDTDLWQQFPGARELEFGRVYEQVMTTRQPAAFQAYYPGLQSWFELRVQPAEEGIGCFFLDVTDRHLAEERAAVAVARAEFIREVTDALSSNLDVVSNVNRLARLVVPHLGTWSIVSIAEPDGTLVDTAWWHPDPARLRLVDRYVEVRQQAMPGTIADEALQERRPVALLADAHVRIRSRLEGEALARFDELAPVGSAVLPMVARGRTIGLLSLYSDEVLTEEQYETAKDVAARAALALDNSLAYGRESAARADAESARAAAVAATGRLALLARVGEALSGGEHPDVAVGRLARLVVPQLADWSIVTVVDDEGEARNIGSAHRDPELEPLVVAYAARRSASLTEESPLRTALRSGQTWRSDAVAEEFVQRVQPDHDAIGLLDRLHPHGVAVIPLTARGRVFGALTLVTTHERGSHTADELAVAQEVARRAAPVLDSARSAHRARQLAEVVQRSLLSVPAVPPGLDIAVRYRPAQADNEVGGDWYDHFDLPDGSTFVAIGDVMGHDIDAIAAMAQLRTLMRAAAWTARRSPAEVVTDTDSANRALGPGMLATCLAAVLEPQQDGTVAMRWSSAGHPPALVVEPDGSARLLDDIELDPPLGVRTIVPRRDHSATLTPGATLVLFTDGLVERRGRLLDDGLAELCRVAVEHRHLDLDGLLDGLFAQLAPSGSRHDDVAVLALRVAPVAAGSGDRLLVRLVPDTAAPATARDHLRAYTRGMPDQLVQDAALITSELVTNALRHGAPPITLDIRRIPEGVRVAVNDRSDDYPVLPGRDPATTSTSGRGLLLTDLLATSWGIDPAPAGKTVWFTMIGEAKVVDLQAVR